MESRQTNLGVFSIGVENSNNGSCDFSGFWGILKVLATIGLTILLGFILFRCLSAYCAKRKHVKTEKQQRMVEMLEERVNNKNTAIKMQNDRSCSQNHLHIPKQDFKNWRCTFCQQ